MRLRDLLYIIWATEVLIMTPENSRWDTFRGKSNGIGSAMSYACEQYGDRDVDCLLVNDRHSCTISLY